MDKSTKMSKKIDKQDKQSTWGYDLKWLELGIIPFKLI